MSTVNRNSHKVKTHTSNTEQTYLPNSERILSVLKEYLANFEIDTVDPNLNNLVTSAKENIEASLKRIQRLKEVNSRLGRESDLLIDVAEDADFIRIKTEPVETALRDASLNVDGFYNFANHYTDSLVRGIKEKIIEGTLVDFRIKVTQKLNNLNQQMQRLSEMSSEEGEQDNSQEIAKVSAQIDHLKRCISASELYVKRLHQIGLDLEKTKNAAYEITATIRKINSRASKKIDAIKQAVNN